MTRYTINIGDDFPLGGDEAAAGGPQHGRHRRRRHGLLLRVLFFLAVAAIVMSHPLKTLLVTGVVLFLMRSGYFGELRERLRHARRSVTGHDWQHEMRWCRDRWQDWQARWRSRYEGRRPVDDGRREEHDRYRGFV